MSRSDPTLFSDWLRLSEQALRDIAAGQQQLREACAGLALAEAADTAADERQLARGSGEWRHERLGAGAFGARSYRLFLPAQEGGPRGLPLLVLLHGCGQDSLRFARLTRAAAHARHKRFALLLPEQAPEANAQRCWNWFAPEAVLGGEAAILMAIIERAVDAHALDATRVFALGLSAGGAMAMALALRHADRFRALGSHSGPLPLPPGADAGGAPGLDFLTRRAAHGGLPPLILLQGDADPLVPASTAQACAELWRALQADGAGEPRCTEFVSEGRRPLTRLDWGPAAAPALRLLRIHGLGHAWSGGAAGQPFADPAGPDALRLAWQFFALPRH